jgi:hypothetical protein
MSDHPHKEFDQRHQDRFATGGSLSHSPVANISPYPGQGEAKRTATPNGYTTMPYGFKASLEKSEYPSMFTGVSLRPWKANIDGAALLVSYEEGT